MTGVEADVVKVNDYGVIAGYRIMSAPRLIIDGRVLSSGRVPAPADISRSGSRGSRMGAGSARVQLRRHPRRADR